ncbi:unnamed protein product [Vitrella brassicaformis CCMP3155]|uniref:Uncharacterized protein n=1 Tax=Vitrella brassicaformis (strain CCMP3155) TaxID=1169540 RepID=A0A0G4GEX9_VITBC|nr:unnamed protein product [Vitrella brassicaformis CCMP3155]|eukprot:CEM27734.1 unnamed protein product [Vitrella brassicaformis CCMP3155]
MAIDDYCERTSGKTGSELDIMPTYVAEHHYISEALQKPTAELKVPTLDLDPAAREDPALHPPAPMLLPLKYSPAKQQQQQPNAYPTILPPPATADGQHRNHRHNERHGRHNGRGGGWRGHRAGPGGQKRSVSSLPSFYIIRIVSGTIAAYVLYLSGSSSLLERRQLVSRRADSCGSCERVDHVGFDMGKGLLVTATLWEVKGSGGRVDKVAGPVMLDCRDMDKFRCGLGWCSPSEAKEELEELCER